VQALNGEAASLYDPASFTAVQTAFVGPPENPHSNWLYPPIFLLVMPPLAALPYFWAFVASDLVTLLGSLIVVYAIIRGPPAIAVALASLFRPGGITLGSTPVGTLVVITPFGEISRRTFSRRDRAFTHTLPLVKENLHARRHVYVRLRPRRATIK
jgi:hypothetical protein